MTNASDLKEFLYDCCIRDKDLLADVVDEYLLLLTSERRSEIEDLLVNNFGDD